MSQSPAPTTTHTTTTAPKKRSKIPQPFRYRGRWRAQVTLPNGTRPHADFATQAEAAQWITQTRALSDSTLQPELGGPKHATLARALHLYAHLHTINKGGHKAELDRINHYLAGAGLPRLKRHLDEQGRASLQPLPAHTAMPSAFEAHRLQRLAKRAATYAYIAELAQMRCSTIGKVHIRQLMSVMKSEGLQGSTIQKEIALLRHMFNMAAQEWAWEGFENPTAGIKLAQSNQRFVVLDERQAQALWEAAQQCDNVYVYPLLICAVETTLRRKSLLSLRWDSIDLEHRITYIGSKTGAVAIPLSLKARDALRAVPRHPSGLVFPMSPNAVDKAWEGVREKAGLPKLQFRDLRHVGATFYARNGLNSHQLRAVLGHKTLHMAQVYVNFAQRDVLQALDHIAERSLVIEVPPPASCDAATSQRESRTKRLVQAAEQRLQALHQQPCAPQPGPLEQHEVEPPALPEASSDEHQETFQSSPPMAQPDYRRPTEPPVSRHSTSAAHAGEPQLAASIDGARAACDSRAAQVISLQAVRAQRQLACGTDLQQPPIVGTSTS